MNQYIRATILLGCVAMTIILYLVWLGADNNPDKRACVNVNSVGEADLERIIMPIFVVLSVWAGISNLLDSARGLKHG